MFVQEHDDGVQLYPWSAANIVVVECWGVFRESEQEKYYNIYRESVHVQYVHTLYSGTVHTVHTPGCKSEGWGGGNSSVMDIRLVYIACEISKHLAKVFNNLLSDF